MSTQERMNEDANELNRLLEERRQLLGFSSQIVDAMASASKSQTFGMHNIGGTMDNDRNLERREVIYDVNGGQLRQPMYVAAFDPYRREDSLSGEPLPLSIYSPNHKGNESNQLVAVYRNRLEEDRAKWTTIFNEVKLFPENPLVFEKLHIETRMRAFVEHINDTILTKLVDAIRTFDESCTKENFMRDYASRITIVSKPGSQRKLIHLDYRSAAHPGKELLEYDDRVSINIDGQTITATFS